MPELPDVELFRRQSRRAFGRRIARVVLDAPRLLDGISSADLAAALEGNRFVSSRRHGKHLFIGLERNGWLALHFGMTGTLVPLANSAEAPQYTRMRVDFTDGGALAYTSVRLLGRIGLTDEVRRFVAERGLGIDVLDRRFDARTFERMLAKRKGRRGLGTPIKAILMDQSLMAGIGNIYSDEILYQARVHPLTPANHLTAAQVEAVFRSVRRVLRTAIERRADSAHLGVRLPCGFLLRVRGPDGHCPRCRENLATFRLGGRTGYYCPRCQAAVAAVSNSDVGSRPNRSLSPSCAPKRGDRSRVRRRLRISSYR
jgi:formamidopyrimidine-DNA glycosylase